jgi:ABC-type nitrate/sulfonate/bicarbonate transport system substrate-binding protein
MVSAAMIIALAACGGGEKGAGEGGDGITRLEVGTSASITLHSLPAIAAKKGFDTDNGLDLEITSFPSGSGMVEAVAAGDIGIAQAGDVPFASLIAGGVPVKLVAQLTDSGANYTFWMAEEFAPQNAEGIEGRTIGVPFGSTSSLIMSQFIETYGLDEKSIDLVDLEPDAIAAAYAAKDIDGFILWSPGSDQAASQRDSVKIHDAYESYLPCCEGPKLLGAAHTVVFARDDVLSDDPETVERYLQTLADARAFTLDSQTRDEAIGIVAEALDIDQDIVAGAMKQIEFAFDLDQDLLDDLDAVATGLEEAGSIQSPPPIPEVVDSGPLSEVAPEFVDL